MKNTSKHTFVFSDLHLALEAPEHPVWMRFRQRCNFIDDDFGNLADRLLDQVGDAPFEVIFNGDTFELDGANAYSHQTDPRPADLGNEPSEALGLDRILRDHPGFVAAGGRLLARAERLVFVTGNHDLGLCWPTARRILRRRLVRAARVAGASTDARQLSERVVFAPWLYRSGDGLYVEHGQQYDPASATPDPLLPTRSDGRGLWQSFGSAGYRHVLRSIGTMNPHNHDTYLLGGAIGYARHYLRYYLGRRRSLVRSWLGGSLRCARHMLAQREEHTEPGTAARWDALAAETKASGLSTHQLRRLRSLQVRPVSDSAFAILRELWLDRVALGTAALGVVIALALLAPFWVTALATALLVAGLATYERLAPDNNLEAYQAGLEGQAARITGITGDHVVVLGHTHRPRHLTLPSGGTLINTGSWAPSFADPECTRPVDSHRTFAWIRRREGVVTSASLLQWRHDRLVTFDPRTASCACPACVCPAPANERSTPAQTQAA